MDGSQVGVLKEGDEVGLGSLLESHDGRRLESEVGLEKRSQRGRVSTWRRWLTLKSWAISRTSRWKGSFLIRSSVDLRVIVNHQDSQEASKDSLLVSSDFSESDGTGPVPVGLLDTTSGGGGSLLPGSLGGD